MSKVKIDVDFEVTPYGRAAVVFDRARKNARVCDAKIASADVLAWRQAQGDNDDGCNALAKVVIDGKHVCAKHAGSLLLVLALRGRGVR